MTHLVQRIALILLAGVALPTLADASTRTAAPAVVGVDAAARTSKAASTYTVRRGDTLAKVAVKLGSDVETLAEINGLKKPYRLDTGQVIKGPRAKVTSSREKPTRNKAAAMASAETYIVQRGDTLFAIARRAGTTVAALQTLNGLGRSADLTPGRKLRLSGDHKTSQAVEEVAEAPVIAEKPVRRSSIPPDTTATGRSVTGKVVNIETPGTGYRVKKGDTLEKVARRLDSGIDELARINKLKRPYRLQPGETIRGPGATAKAYVVARGDTLAEIAQRFGVSVDKLRSANGLRRGASVAPGRKLRLPTGYRDRGPITDPTREADLVIPAQRTTPSVQTLPMSRPVEPPAAGLPTTPQPYVPPSRPARRPSQSIPPSSGPIDGAPVASPAASDAQITQMGAGRFAWPLRGDVISGFGSKGTGQRNDGLNIRANSGDPVRSAADGDVVYAGDQVPGFGNLVLVKHADGWVTAYGHLSRVGVRMQQKVRQGQEIGQAGSSGGVSEPQLHFEVRFAPTPQERARPIDPALVLPR